MRARIFPAILPLLPLLLHGQPNSDALLQQARARIADNVSKLPKYTCVQTIERSKFQMYNGPKKKSCDDRAAAARAQSHAEILLAWKDQFKLDVTVSDGAEIFSWAGARAFQSADAQEIVGGGLTGNGDFGPFLMDIFGGAGVQFQFAGMERDEGLPFAAYRYQVPASASHYQIKVGTRRADTATLAYEGEFWIDTQSAALHRLTIVAPNPPAHAETCRVETEIDYRPVAIAGAPLLLPEATFLKLWDADGSRYENQSAYASCRAFQSESVFRPETEGSAGDPAAAAATPAARAAAAAIPPGLTVQLALRSPIDMAAAFGGDPVEAQLDEALRAPGGAILAPRGAIVRGRIVRAERHFVPSTYFALGLRFDAIVLGGVEVPLALDREPRAPEERMATGDLERREGIGMFLFHGDLRVLDENFTSEWKTSARKPE